MNVNAELVELRAESDFGLADGCRCFGEPLGFRSFSWCTSLWFVLLRDSLCVGRRSAWWLDELFFAMVVVDDELLSYGLKEMRELLLALMAGCVIEVAGIESLGPMLFALELRVDSDGGCVLSRLAESERLLLQLMSPSLTKLADLRFSEPPGNRKDFV